MSDFRVGHDGTRFNLVVVKDDGTTLKARLMPGSHTDQDFDNAIGNARQAYATLRTWATDAATTNSNWPTMTVAQKDTATRETIRRLGIFLDRFGDLLLALNADS